MRKFDPEKELRKIQKGNKNKVILFVISLLVVGVIGYSFALYQIRYNKQIIYTTVAPFYSKDFQLAVYVDDIKEDKFPNKETYYFDKVICDNNSKWEFDYDNWKLMLKTDHQDKCNIYFTKNYRDRSGANAPELYQGMIPIYFEDKDEDSTPEIYIADVEKEWYDYDKHNWGNAVLIDYENKKDTFYDENNKLRVNTQIQEEDILQMYVWIPRYKYKIFSLGNTSTPKQIIDIKFEAGGTTTGDFECTYEIGAGVVTESCPGIDIGKWYTHSAFTFKGTADTSGTELPGIWVGKFEPSDAQDEIGRNSTIGEITILPNKTSMIYKNVSTMFYAERDMEEKYADKYNIDKNTIDTHMMKNIEWGAVAYLTQSKYGIYTNDGEGCVIEGMNKNDCEVWINNTSQGSGTFGSLYYYGGTYTGCAGDTVSAGVKWNRDNTDGTQLAECDEKNRWNKKGVNASTTGNMYGIYDTSGGTWEYMMGVILQDGKNDVHLGISGFKTDSEPKLPDSKYYDVYTFDANSNTQERGHYGDATKEIVQTFGDSYGAWNSDTSIFLSVDTDGTWSWFIRGSRYDAGANTGVLAFDHWPGGAYLYSSFRSVLSAT